MSEVEPIISEPNDEPVEAKVSTESREGLTSREERAAVCRDMASAACGSCAISGSCPILKLRSPEATPFTPKNLLNDEDNLIVATDGEAFNNFDYDFTKTPQINQPDDIPLNQPLEPKPVTPIDDFLDNVRKKSKPKDVNIWQSLYKSNEAKSKVTKPAQVERSVEKKPDETDTIVYDKPVYGTKVQPELNHKPSRKPLEYRLEQAKDEPEKPTAAMIDAAVTVESDQSSEPTQVIEIPQITPNKIDKKAEKIVIPATTVVDNSSDTQNRISPIETETNDIADDPEPITQKPLELKNPPEYTAKAEQIAKDTPVSTVKIEQAPTPSITPESIPAPTLLTKNKSEQVVNPNPSIKPELPYPVERQTFATEQPILSTPETPEILETPKIPPVNSPQAKPQIQFETPKSFQEPSLEPAESLPEKTYVLVEPTRQADPNLPIEPTRPSVDLSKLANLEPDASHPVEPLQPKVLSQTEVEIETEALTETAIQIDPQAIFQTETRIEPLQKEFSQPDAISTLQSEPQTESIPEKLDDVVVKTTTSHEPQKTPDIALSDIPTLDIAVDSTTTDNQIAVEPDIEIEPGSLFDDEQAEPTTSGYGKTSWLNELIGKLACAAIQRRQILSSSKYDLVA